MIEKAEGKSLSGLNGTSQAATGSSPSLGPRKVMDEPNLYKWVGTLCVLISFQCWILGENTAGKRGSTDKGKRNLT